MKRFDSFRIVGIEWLWYLFSNDFVRPGPGIGISMSLTLVSTLDYSISETRALTAAITTRHGTDEFLPAPPPQSTADHPTSGTSASCYCT